MMIFFYGAAEKIRHPLPFKKVIVYRPVQLFAVRAINPVLPDARSKNGVFDIHDQCSARNKRAAYF